ncbi:MAG: hypothetical protein JWP30_704, partial [Homoserinimonas sp.]|nr:hypothetical protein [Homoserinimonas sp.]
MRLLPYLKADNPLRQSSALQGSATAWGGPTQSGVELAGWNSRRRSVPNRDDGVRKDRAHEGFVWLMRFSSPSGALHQVIRRFPQATRP